MSLLAVFPELITEEMEEENKEHTCETLLMCIVTVLSHGLRSGGGVGDVLRKPSKEVNHHSGAGGVLLNGTGICCARESGSAAAHSHRGMRCSWGLG